MNASIEKFVKRTKSISDSEYGDFMRTENVYLNHLIRELDPLVDDRDINRRLVEMQTYLQFTPNWDVNLTKEKLLEDAQYIDELMNAHRQDWESSSMYS
ncbi:MAG: hypothetical protein L6Q37_09540 [Bdellovibrionaceae bacterium]|nr:hypothetical protein [Pseudobdellovibrionaceae bacterium]NUM57322.1 hypothetical protein [Pseudobdellovibrionaceae bacterium]